MNNKSVFARNLKKYMGTFGKSRKDVCNDLGFSYYTFSDWVNGKKYPRMDKVEMLAGYFGIKKSDLIEDKEEQKQKTGIAVEIVVRLGEDRDFCEAVEMLNTLDAQQLSSVKAMLRSFLQK